MAHFAYLNDMNVVESVIVADQEFVDTLEAPERWIQTSFNTRGGVHYNSETGEPSADQSKALRKNFAGIGYTYDPGRDAFIPPRPEGEGWELVEETCLWVNPTLPVIDNPQP